MTQANLRTASRERQATMSRCRPTGCALWVSLFVVAITGAALPVNAQAPLSPGVFHPTSTSGRGFGADGPADLLFHGGPIMPSVTAYLIFWLPPGTHFSSPVSDANYEQLLQRYFEDIGGSPFYNIVTQYPGANGTPTTNISVGAAFVDTNPYPRAGTMADPLLDSDLIGEIDSVIIANGWPTGLNTMYFLFTGSGIQSCFDASHTSCSFAQYCAYHSYFVGPGPGYVVYANLPDGNSIARCNAEHSGYATGDTAVDLEMDLLSHEHFEAVTDPLLNAWFDSHGSEIGDKCVLNYGPGGAATPNVTLNGDPYHVQGEWSNVSNACAFALSCPSSPAPGCRTAGSSSLLLSAPLDPSKNALNWSWSKGEATSSVEFGNPTSTTSYGLCFYEGTQLIFDAELPNAALDQGVPCWSAAKNGYKFKNKRGAYSGLTSIGLAGSAGPKSKIKVIGKGYNLRLPTLGFASNVTVQAINDTPGVCFEATYSGPDFIVNDTAKFKAKHKAP